MSADLPELRFVQALASWSDPEPPRDSGLAERLGQMRQHAAKLDWLAMLDRLAGAAKDRTSTTGPSPGAEFITLARDVLAGTLGFAPALERVQGLSLPDFDRAILCLFVACEPTLLEESVHVALFRLAAETAGDAELAARIYSTLGRSMGSEPAWAMHAFDAGLRRLVDQGMPGLQARLYLDLARCHSQTGQREDAMVEARAAGVLADRGGDPTTADLAALLHATLLLESNRPEEAVKAIAPLAARQRETGAADGVGDASVVLQAGIGQALDQWFEHLDRTEVADPVAGFERVLTLGGPDAGPYPQEARRRLQLAQALFAQGQRTVALAQVKQAVAGLEALNDPESLDDVLVWLAAVGAELLRSGQLVPAIDFLAEAARLAARKPFDDSTAQVRLLHGAALQMAGQTREAEGVLQMVLDECRTHPPPTTEISALYALGENALLERQDALARDRFENAARCAEEINHPVLLASSLNKLGATWSLLREPARALGFHERALSLHRAAAWLPGVVVDLIQTAQVCLDAGQLQRATEFAAELAVLGPQHLPPEPEWIPFVLARVAAAGGDWSRARGFFREVFAALEKRRGGFETAEAQRRWSEQKADTYGLAIEAAIAAGAAADAIEFLESGRTRYLQALTRVNADRPPRPWDELAPAIPCSYTAVWFGGFPRGLGVVTASRSDDGTVRLACRFDRSLTGDELATVFSGDLRAVLHAHTSGQLVDHLVRSVREGRELDLGANAYWQRHGETWKRSLDQVCDFLKRRVWPTLLETMAADSPNLLLLPSVGCSEMPMAAAAPDTTAAGKPVNLCVAPSLTLIAGPDLERPLEPRGDFTFAQIVNPSEDPTLPCCVIEARLAVESFGRSVVTHRGRRATRQRVLDALATQDVFHFLGHAFVDWSDPLQSGLVCAPRPDDAGVLTVQDILAGIGRIRSRLIVLSACQIGHVQPGDRQNDFLNLPAALIAAGARTVVAPRWEVDDLPTALLLSRMLNLWFRDAVPIPRALAEARRWLRDEVTTEFALSWIAAACVDPNVDRDALQQLQDGYRGRFKPDDRPFAQVCHWGAFEVMGSPIP